jgi:hypothetical protein
MKDWIKCKLDRIDELFPSERLQKSKERWTDVWNGKKPKDRYPFLTGFPSFNPYNDNHPPEERLKAYLDACIHLGHGNDDFIPSIFPGCNQATIPCMFGAEPVRVGLKTSCRRLIHDAADVDRLPEPALLPGTPAHDWIVMERYLLEETQGRIPIHVCDMQGPVDVCGQLWGYDNLFVCAYEQPEQYNKLMTKVSDAFILFWKEQMKLLGDAFVGTHLFGWNWLPPGMGASLSADSMVMVSPSFFNEFFTPYLARISAEFGGLAVHSCGNYAAVMKELCKVPGLRAINASQMSIQEILAAGFDKSKVIIAMEGKEKAPDVFKLIKQYGLNADVSFIDVWPASDGTAIPVEEWTSEVRYAFQNTEEMLLKAADIRV